MRFEPRHALITGAAGGIGGQLCRRFAERHAALRFSLVDKDEVGLFGISQKLGPRAAALPWDLAVPSTLGDLWQRATAIQGPVDLLINCAGQMEIRSFSATSWELGERLLNINLLSPLRLLQLAAAGMASGGHIVNISSMAGRVSLRGFSYYGAAKAGLGLASEIAALELAERGISVLTVYPGPVRTRLEARGRTQVHEGVLSRSVPVGDPAVLARRIERALRRGQQRVVYPSIYCVAELLSGLSSRLVGPASPLPTDAP